VKKNVALTSGVFFKVYFLYLLKTYRNPTEELG